MIIKIREQVVNLQLVTQAEIERDQVVFRLADGSRCYLKGPEILWAMTTLGVLPIADLEIAYTNKSQVEGALQTQRQQPSLPPQTVGLSGQMTPSDPELADLEDQLRNIDSVLEDAAVDPSGLDEMTLRKARARRDQLAQIINQAKKVQ